MPKTRKHRSSLEGYDDRGSEHRCGCAADQVRARLALPRAGGPFRDGGPHAVEAFGTKLVVFADSAGELHVLDGYCRHMGGDLTRGTSRATPIACPFHDWRWGGDGRCAEIPYARRVPPAARTRSWLTLEQNQQLFVWHDPQGNPPPART